MADSRNEQEICVDSVRDLQIGASTRIAGRNLVRDDAKWFGGTVVRTDSDHFHITYDDGSESDYELSGHEHGIVYAIQCGFFRPPPLLRPQPQDKNNKKLAPAAATATTATAEMAAAWDGRSRPYKPQGKKKGVAPPRTPQTKQAWQQPDQHPLGPLLWQSLPLQTRPKTRRRLPRPRKTTASRRPATTPW